MLYQHIMTPYFSIIIPACNEENYIRSTLHSIKNQTYQDFEVIVVANGCTDKTEEMVKKRADEKLRLLSLPKANVSVARNAGALNAQGEVLVFLDADTQLMHDSLQKIRQQFLPEHSVATTTVIPDDNTLKFRLLMGLKNMGMKSKICRAFGGIFICKKEHFQQVNGYNPEITVKEHGVLREKMEKLGKYSVIDTSTITSMRRYKKQGLVSAGAFWMKYLLLKKNGYEKVR